MADLRLREPSLGWRGTPGGQNDGLKSRARDSVVQRQAISILLIFLSFFGVAVLLQWLGGAYAADLAGFDESAHYVTGLMVRSFLISADWLEPLQFARAYYDVYPKVAIGHWPPGFYVLQALWTLIFSSSRESILLLMALLAATCSTLTYLFWRPAIGQIAAAAAGLVFLCVPVVQQSTQSVMAELLIASLSILAIWSYSIYLRSERTRDSLVFGFIASFAILSKSNALSLACVPPLAILLTQKSGLARRLAFWLPAVVVLITCAPWYLMTLEMAQRGWQGSMNARFLLRRVAPNNLGVFYSELGSAIVLLALIGVFGAVIRPIWKRRPVHPIWAVSFAALVGMFLFHTFIVPVRESRHFVSATPMALAFAASGLLMLLQQIRLPYVSSAPQWRAFIVGFAIVITFGVQSFTLVRKPTYGATGIAGILTSNQYANAPILVSSSDSRGEGAIIAELAMRSPAPERRVFRASKVLAHSSWSGNSYKLVTGNPEQIRRIISDLGIDVVVWQTPISDKTDPHHYELGKLLHGDPQGFRRIHVSEKGNTFEVYDIYASAGR